MKLQCAQEALAEALATVGRVVPGKSTLPVLTNVLLEADPGDGLRLVATNLDLTVSRRLRATVSTAGRTTVPARLLADYVALLDRGKQLGECKVALVGIADARRCNSIAEFPQHVLPYKPVNASAQPLA